MTSCPPLLTLPPRLARQAPGHCPPPHTARRHPASPAKRTATACRYGAASLHTALLPSVLCAACRHMAAPGQGTGVSASRAPPVCRPPRSSTVKCWCYLDPDINFCSCLHPDMSNPMGHPTPTRNTWVWAWV
ncbi:hypothetical protein PR202_gb23560 [Eleusine coracana subsp. coracana]|uniref:Uncharacterized protein n=1 Tax=Eleusine coracana subsp. coracana TaxID=191504 RepID=A0AAV5FKG2_ELECO|nr:hypothetical protein PR202_gb23560 [Eleusine coracana subsp. coracana]